MIELEGKIYSLIEEAYTKGVKTSIEVTKKGDLKGRMNFQGTSEVATVYLLAQILDQIREYQAELERFRKHRHKTFGEGYSEKPAW